MFGAKTTSPTEFALTNVVNALVLLDVKASYCVSVDNLRGHPRCVAPVKLGWVENTRLPPVPVSSVHAVRMFELEKVPNIVATFVPSPLTPVAIGNPVQFVNVPAEGVPMFGVEDAVIFLPLVSLKAATCPTVAVVEFVTTFAAISAESVIIFPVASEKLAKLPVDDTPVFDTMESTERVEIAPEMFETFFSSFAPKSTPPVIMPPDSDNFVASAAAVASELSAVPESCTTFGVAENVAMLPETPFVAQLKMSFAARVFDPPDSDPMFFSSCAPRSMCPVIVPPVKGR